MDPKRRRKAKASRGGLCQHTTMTRDVRIVVTSITVITASPAEDSEGTFLLALTTKGKSERLKHGDELSYVESTNCKVVAMQPQDWY